MRQCEIVAVVKDRKDRAAKALTEAYHFVQRADLFAGLIRSYTPRAEGDEALPTERKNPHTSVPALLDRVRSPLTDLLDTVLTQEPNWQRQRRQQTETHTPDLDQPQHHVSSDAETQ